LNEINQLIRLHYKLIVNLGVIYIAANSPSFVAKFTTKQGAKKAKSKY